MFRTNSPSVIGPASRKSAERHRPKDPAQGLLGDRHGAIPVQESGPNRTSTIEPRRGQAASALVRFRFKDLMLVGVLSRKGPGALRSAASSLHRPWWARPARRCSATRCRVRKTCFQGGSQFARRYSIRRRSAVERVKEMQLRIPPNLHNGPQTDSTLGFQLPAFVVSKYF